MSLASGLRSLDRFGSSVSFNIDGESQTKTLGGGVATLLIEMLILCFFCKQLIAVVNDEDPQISSYRIAEDRLRMEEQLDFAEYHTKFYFFWSGSDNAPVQFEPRFGSF